MSITLPVGYYLLIPVLDYTEDGVTLDTAEALTVNSSQSGFATVSVDPVDKRLVRVVGVLAGTTVITVGAPNVPTAGQLTVSITVTPPPNLTKVVLAPAGISTPQPLGT